MSDCKSKHYRYGGKTVFVYRNQIEGIGQDGLGKLLDEIMERIRKYADQLGEKAINEERNGALPANYALRLELFVRITIEKLASAASIPMNDDRSLMKSEQPVMNTGQSSNRTEQTTDQAIRLPRQSDRDPDEKTKITSPDQTCELIQGETSTKAVKRIKSRRLSQQTHKFSNTESETDNRYVVTIDSEYGRHNQPNKQTGHCEFVWDEANARCISFCRSN